MRVEQENLKELIPDYYKNIYEMDKLEESERWLFENVRMNTQRVQENATIMLCDEPSLRLYEDMLRIVADPISESMEFRRLRVINRINSRPPFTLKFLIEKLNDIFGANNYELRIDYDHYTLYIESAVSSFSWYQEVNHTLNTIKPTNIVYVQVPLLSENIRILEKAYLIKVLYARVGYAQVGITALEKRAAEEEVRLQ